MTPRFRLGSTSYVIAGDLLQNLHHLVGAIQDMELVLFDLPDGTSNLPDTSTVQQMAMLAREQEITFTVHLPLDLAWSSQGLHPSLALSRRVIDLTRPLHPYAYIFHLETSGVEQPGWAEQGIEAIRWLLPLVDAPEQLALENLESYRPDELEPVFAALPISRTLDIGHLWKAGLEPLDYLPRWLPQTRVIHLHGMNGNDHQSLAVMAPERLDPVLRHVVDWPGVLTLEVFEQDFDTSRATLFATLERLRL